MVSASMLKSARVSSALFDCRFVTYWRMKSMPSCGFCSKIPGISDTPEGSCLMAISDKSGPEGELL